MGTAVLLRHHESGAENLIQGRRNNDCKISSPEVTEADGSQSTNADVQRPKRLLLDHPASILRRIPL